MCQWDALGILVGSLGPAPSIPRQLLEARASYLCGPCRAWRRWGWPRDRESIRANPALDPRSPALNREALASAANRRRSETDKSYSRGRTTIAQSAGPSLEM